MALSRVISFTTRNTSIRQEDEDLGMTMIKMMVFTMMMMLLLLDMIMMLTKRTVITLIKPKHTTR